LELGGGTTQRSCASQVVPSGQTGWHRGLAQTFAVPPAPQSVPAAHVPQLRTLPQPSLTRPQLRESDAQVAELQLPTPQLFATPPAPQVWDDAHAPQLRVPPQPSGAAPQVAPRVAQV
jgi:hypothetical protein